ncbi:MAG: hypothetical protein ACRDX8_10485 [Acidimicrobiales bacterium]
MIGAVTTDVPEVAVPTPDPVTEETGGAGGKVVVGEGETPVDGPGEGEVMGAGE